MGKEKSEAVRDSLEQLPVNYRNLILRRLNGDLIEEIARGEGVPLGTAKSRLFRAIKKMRYLVAGYFGGKSYEEI